MSPMDIAIGLAEKCLPSILGPVCSEHPLGWGRTEHQHRGGSRETSHTRADRHQHLGAT